MKTSEMLRKVWGKHWDDTTDKPVLSMRVGVGHEGELAVRVIVNSHVFLQPFLLPSGWMNGVIENHYGFVDGTHQLDHIRHYFSELFIGQATVSRVHVASEADTPEHLCIHWSEDFDYVHVHVKEAAAPEFTGHYVLLRHFYNQWVAFELTTNLEHFTKSLSLEGLTSSCGHCRSEWAMIEDVWEVV